MHCRNYVCQISIGAKITSKWIKPLSKLFTEPIEETTTDYQATKKKGVLFPFAAEMETVIREILAVLTKPPMLVIKISMQPETARENHICTAMQAQQSLAQRWSSHKKTTRCGR